MMDGNYLRKLLMLQGTGSQTGFVNLELQRGRLTLKFQVVGLPRGAGNVHGKLVSLRERKQLDCGPLQVDARGQGGLLKEWIPRELEGLSLDAFDYVLVTSGGQAMLASPLWDKAVDWERIRSFLQSLAQPRTPKLAEAPKAQPSKKIPQLIEHMEPPVPEEKLTMLETLDQAMEGEEDLLLAQAGQWPRWAAQEKPTYEWPESAEDLKQLFERGVPYEQLDLPGWQFVKAPSGAGYEDSVLGIFVQDGRVVQSASLLRGEEAPEPPPGLDGYVYARNIGEGYWTQWRDYEIQMEEKQIG